MSEKINVTVENGVKELIIRNGEAVTVFTGRDINISGVTIPAVCEFLSKPDINHDLILDSVLKYSIDDLTMSLFYAQTSRHPYTIKSKVELNPDLKDFGINSGKRYSTFDLADFFKMNRHLFQSKATAMELVSLLKNFKAKVDRDIENSSNDRGNRKVLLNQTIDSNIPESFILLLPIFKGYPAAEITIEININDDFDCLLISPDLKEMIATESKALIDDQLDKIKVLHPDLRIYQE